MTDHPWQLIDLGWNAHFRAQMAPSDLDSTVLVRVMAVHRDALEVAGPLFEGRVPPFGSETDPDPTRHRATVGDWLVLDNGANRAIRLLDRRSVFKRKSAGGGRGIQLLAANVDTVFLVTSANAEFNPARLERYLAVAREAQVTPVVVITKVDQAGDSRPFLTAARELAPNLVALAIDARSASEIVRLRPWLEPGQTVALLGSSGVGKSTLVNTLAGAPLQAAGTIREADAKGRHTTRRRSLHRLPWGAWLVDTPGMRELQLVDAARGLDEVFDDITTLAGDCRFADCTHALEPGCVIRQAISAGTLDPARLTRFRKLTREDRHNSESIAEARARARTLGKHAKEVFQAKRHRRGEP